MKGNNALVDTRVPLVPASKKTASGQAMQIPQSIIQKNHQTSITTKPKTEIMKSSSIVTVSQQQTAKDTPNLKHLSSGQTMASVMLPESINKKPSLANDYATLLKSKQGSCNNIVNNTAPPMMNSTSANSAVVQSKIFSSTQSKLKPKEESFVNIIPPIIASTNSASVTVDQSGFKRNITLSESSTAADFVHTHASTTNMMSMSHSNSTVANSASTAYRLMQHEPLEKNGLISDFRKKVELVSKANIANDGPNGDSNPDASAPAHAMTERRSLISEQRLRSLSQPKYIAPKPKKDKVVHLNQKIPPPKSNPHEGVKAPKVKKKAPLSKFRKKKVAGSVTGADSSMGDEGEEGEDDQDEPSSEHVADDGQREKPRDTFVASSTNSGTVVAVSSHSSSGAVPSSVSATVARHGVTTSPITTNTSGSTTSTTPSSLPTVVPSLSHTPTPISAVLESTADSSAYDRPPRASGTALPSASSPAPSLYSSTSKFQGDRLSSPPMHVSASKLHPSGYGLGSTIDSASPRTGICPLKAEHRHVPDQRRDETAASSALAMELTAAAITGIRRDNSFDNYQKRIAVQSAPSSVTSSSVTLESQRAGEEPPVVEPVVTSSVRETVRSGVLSSSNAATAGNSGIGFRKKTQQPQQAQQQYHQQQQTLLMKSSAAEEGESLRIAKRRFHQSSQSVQQQAEAAKSWTLTKTAAVVTGQPSESVDWEPPGDGLSSDKRGSGGPALKSSLRQTSEGASSSSSLFARKKKKSVCFDLESNTTLEIHRIDHDYYESDYLGTSTSSSGTSIIEPYPCSANVSSSSTYRNTGTSSNSLFSHPGTSTTLSSTKMGSYFGRVSMSTFDSKDNEYCSNSASTSTSTSSYYSSSSSNEGSSGHSTGADGQGSKSGANTSSYAADGGPDIYDASLYRRTRFTVNDLRSLKPVPLSF